jgi:trk system potassium uptake protein TrkH
MLMLPFATKSGSIAWEDALFTACSALCVTGLTVVDTGSFFTIYGQLIILALIQVGGIGIMTFAVFVSTGWRISVKQRRLKTTLQRSN